MRIHLSENDKRQEFAPISDESDMIPRMTCNLSLTSLTEPYSCF